MDVLKPGSIVLAHYCDFDGTPKDGVFCIIYDEQLDFHNNHKGNVTALKVTTAFTSLSNYSVCLADGNNDFIERDSFCQCSKIHTLDKATQIYRHLGDLHKNTYKKVYKIHKAYEAEKDRQMEDYL